MKLTIQSDSLQKKLSFLNHAISSKSQLPILLNFLLVAKDQTLSLKATDLEIGIQTHISASVEQEGSVTVPAKIFTELISSLPPEKITLQQTDKGLEIISKKTKSFFTTTPSEEFPKLYTELGEEIATITKQTLDNDLIKIVFAASLDIGRPALSGILIKKETTQSTQGFLLVATDGYRLSLKHHTIETTMKKNDWEGSIIIPARVLKEVLQIKHDGVISLFISKKNNQVLFKIEETIIIGRLIEAEFPNYERIIPSDFGTKVLFDRQELQYGVKTASIFAKEAAHILKLSFHKDKIIVSANTPSVGQNTVEVEAELTGEENEIAFNGRYLLDMLSNIEENELVFEMTGPLNPGVFKIANDPSYLHIIMPIRIQAPE